VAVEPRKINPPSLQNKDSASQAEPAGALVDRSSPVDDAETDEKKSSPLIPILAAIVAVVVVALLVKVLRAK
jgi:hypothetical protein